MRRREAACWQLTQNCFMPTYSGYKVFSNSKRSPRKAPPQNLASTKKKLAPHGNHYAF